MMFLEKDGGVIFVMTDGMTLRALIDALRATGIELTGVLKEGRWKTKRIGAEEYASLLK